MTISIEYEAEKKLELPYETIIKDVVEVLSMTLLTVSITDTRDFDRIVLK